MPQPQFSVLHYTGRWFGALYLGRPLEDLSNRVNATYIAQNYHGEYIVPFLNLTTPIEFPVLHILKILSCLKLSGTKASHTFPYSSAIQLPRLGSLQLGSISIL